MTVHGLKSLARIKMFLHKVDAITLAGGEIGVLSPAGRVTLYSKDGKRLTKKSRLKS